MNEVSCVVRRDIETILALAVFNVNKAQSEAAPLFWQGEARGKPVDGPIGLMRSDLGPALKPRKGARIGEIAVVANGSHGGQRQTDATDLGLKTAIGL